MKIKKTLLAALRNDQDLWETLRGSLRERIDDEGPMSTVIQAAGALEPVLAEAVDKRPSRLRALGLKSASLLGQLAAEDRASNHHLAVLGRGGAVGIVFADVAGFTEFTSLHGDPAAIDLLAHLDSIVTRSAAVGKGEVVKRFGDGYLIAFPTASQAVRAAVDLNRRVEKSKREPPIRLRIAVHVGRPQIESNDLLGHDVNLTARLLDICRPGEVVVSDRARAQAQKRLRTVVFDGLRRVEIRGLEVRQTVWTARSARPDPAP